MKLYYAKGACSLAVRILINEIGIKSDFIAVDLQTKQTENKQDYLKINPKGAVPALETDKGELLTENAVVQQYLADTSNAQKLLPAVGDFQRYRVLEMLNFVGSDLHKSCGPLFNPNVPDQIKKEIFIPNIKKLLTYLDKRLDGKSFLVGDHFTLPDAYLFVILRWMPHLNVDLGEFSQLKRYQAELAKRPSVKKSVEQENLP